MARARTGLLVVGLALLVAGCNVTTRFEVTVRDDGSGTLRTTVVVDADAVQRMGGAHNLAQTVPLGDLRRAGWSITPWKATTNGSETVTLSRGFADQADLTRRIVDLVGRNGILRQPTVTHDRGWFTSHDEVSLVVDVRRPSIDIVHDTALAARLRAAGVDPVSLQAQIAAQLKSALHVSVIVRLPGGRTRSYDAVSGTVKTVRVAAGGTDWDHVVKFGIGAALALLAALFFLAAGVGVRRNRRRALQRVARGPQPERTPLM